MILTVILNAVNRNSNRWYVELLDLFIVQYGISVKKMRTMWTGRTPVIGLKGPGYSALRMWKQSGESGLKQPNVHAKPSITDLAPGDRMMRRWSNA